MSTLKFGECAKRVTTFASANVVAAPDEVAAQLSELRAEVVRLKRQVKLNSPVGRFDGHAVIGGGLSAYSRDAPWLTLLPCFFFFFVEEKYTRLLLCVCLVFTSSVALVAHRLPVASTVPRGVKMSGGGLFVFAQWLRPSCF